MFQNYRFVFQNLSYSRNLKLDRYRVFFSPGLKTSKKKTIFPEKYNPNNSAIPQSDSNDLFHYLLLLTVSKRYKSFSSKLPIVKNKIGNLNRSKFCKNL